MSVTDTVMGKIARILYLEDRQADVERVTELLRRDYVACEVSWVRGREAFLNALEGGWSFDLLVLGDPQVEFLDDGALALARKRWPEWPVIILTERPGEAVALAWLNRGATDSVPKAEPGRLAAAVRRALREARGRAALRAAETAHGQIAGLLRTILESTSEGILVADLAGRITTYNRKFMALCGIPEYVMAPMTLERVLQFLQDQFLDPQAFLSEARMLGTHPELGAVGVLTGKSDRLLEGYVRPHRVGAATVGRVFSFMDMSAARPAPGPEAAAPLPRELLEAARAGRVVPLFLDDDGLVLGEKAARLLDLPQAALPGDLQALEALIHEDDLDAFRLGLEQPQRGAFELRLRKGDGSWIWTRWTLKRGGEGLRGIFTELPGSAEPAAEAPASSAPNPRFSYTVRL